MEPKIAIAETAIAIGLSAPLNFMIPRSKSDDMAVPLWCKSLDGMDDNARKTLSILSLNLAVGCNLKIDSSFKISNSRFNFEFSAPFPGPNLGLTT